MRGLGFFGLVVVCASGCKGSEDPPPPTDTLPPAVCNAGTRWAPGTAVFREVTGDWGLTGVEGVRISAVDFDGDGFTDLAVRRGENLPDELFEGGIRRTWLLRNTGEGAFEDVTISSGILASRVSDEARPGTVYAFADVDNDGDLDVYTGYAPPAGTVSQDRSEVLLNQGDLTFVLGPEMSAARAPGQPAGAAFFDVDRNGVIDLFVGHGGDPLQNVLLGGDATGAFVDVTGIAGMLTQPWTDEPTISAGLAHSRTWGVLACDLNNDGHAELTASSYGRAPSHLWQGTGAVPAVTFVNRSVASGYAFDQRTDWTDNESARCWCTLHPTDEDCAGVPAPEFIACNVDADAFRWDHANDRYPYRLGGNNGTTVCGDVDNDGDMDLVQTTIVHWDVGSSSDPSELLVNSGETDVRFDRPGNDVTGLTRVHDIPGWNDGDMTAAMFDFDNDGWTDIYIGSSDYPGARGHLYHQESPGQFVEVAYAEGIDHTRSHGIGVADFDRDGDLDVIVGHSRARCEAPATDCYATPQVRLFENVTEPGNWLQLSLEGGAGTNRSAIGARVTVTTPDGVSRTQEVGGGHGHYGIQHDLSLHFGLGSECEAEVTVRWPDAALTTQTVKLVAGYRFRLLQGGAPEVVE